MSAPTSHRGLSANSTSFGTVGAPSGNRTCEGGIASPATVIAHYGARRQAQAVLSQASFFSVNDLRLHFGLGPEKTADLTVRWPNGDTERISGVAADRLVTVQ